jgi:hypothetical protein
MLFIKDPGIRPRLSSQRGGDADDCGEVHVHECIACGRGTAGSEGVVGHRLNVNDVDNSPSDYMNRSTGFRTLPRRLPQLPTGTSPQAVDFHSPDTFNFTVLDVSATVMSIGMDSTAQNAAKEYAGPQSRTVFTFRVDAAPSDFDQKRGDTRR